MSNSNSFLYAVSSPTTISTSKEDTILSEMLNSSSAFRVISKFEILSDFSALIKPYTGDELSRIYFPDNLTCTSIMSLRLSFLISMYLHIGI